jgi:hypothetical protein
MKLDDNAVVNAVAKLAKVSDLIEQWHKEAFDRYAWEVEYQQRGGDMRVLIMAREVREQLEQCVTEMRAIVGWPCNGDDCVGQGPQRGIAA